MKPLPSADIADIAAKCRGLPIPQPVLITGATGFIGRWMTESAIAMGLSTYGTARNWPWDWPKSSFFQSYSTDIKRIDMMEHDLDPDCVMPASIIHLAGGDLENAYGTADTIINGTQAVLRMAKKYQCRLLNVSSGAAKERDTVYGHAKRVAELLCEQSGVNCSSIRIYSVYGPGMNLEKYAIGNFIRDGIAGGPIRMMTKGESLRDFKYIADVCVWLWRMLAGCKWEEMYSTEPQPAKRIYEAAWKIADLFGCDDGGGEDGFENGNGNYVSGVTLREEIGLSDGLRRTVEWYKS